jgi:predicted Zn-dependent peptidase
LEQIEKAKSAWLQKRKVSLGDERGFASILVNGLYDGQDFEAIEALDQKIKAVDQRQATDVLKKHVVQSKILWAVGRGGE